MYNVSRLRLSNLAVSSGPGSPRYSQIRIAACSLDNRDKTVCISNFVCSDSSGKGSWVRRESARVKLFSSSELEIESLSETGG